MRQPALFQDRRPRGAVLSDFVLNEMLRKDCHETTIADTRTAFDGMSAQQVSKAARRMNERSAAGRAIALPGWRVSARVLDVYTIEIKLSQVIAMP